MDVDSPGGDVCTPSGKTPYTAASMRFNPLCESPEIKQQQARTPGGGGRKEDLVAFKLRLEQFVAAMDQRILKERQRRSAEDNALRVRIEVLEEQVQQMAAEVALAAEEAMEQKMRADSLQVQLDAALAYAHTAGEEAKGALALTKQLQVSISELAAQSVVADDCATQSMIEAAVQKEVQQQRGQTGGQQQQQQQLATIMVHASADKSAEQVAAETVAAAGMSAAVVVCAHRVFSSKQSANTYSVAAAVAAINNSGNSSSGGSQGASGSGLPSGGVQTRSQGKGDSKSKDSNKCGSSKGKKDAKGKSPALAPAVVACAAAAAPPASVDCGSCAPSTAWFKVQLASPTHAIQLLWKRQTLKQAGFRVEEALSREELATKANYLAEKIPTKVWDAEHLPMSWRRGRLVKLIVKEGERRGRWEEVPITYTPPAKK